jgi:transcriptional regulator with XRE-family HTH domain
MLPGLRLRQARERLGLTYRDVERASLELAARRGRPDFILHISRLADIENQGVVPGLHKLYTLAAIYRLNPLELFRWYDVPIEECFHDGTSFAVPQTHLMAAPTSLRVPMKFDPAFDPRRTEYLSRMVERWGHFEGMLTMQPHPLSHCLPETWRVPEEAGIVGRVTGMVTRLNGPENVPHRESPEERGDSNRKDP